MPTDIQPAPMTTEFDAVLSSLKSLVRDHLLYFRLEVGRVILDGFFGGDAFAYGDRSTGKQAKFSEFMDTHAEELETYGLKPWLLRECVQVQIVHRTLPPTVRDRLGYSHTLELIRVSDPTKRAKLANAAISQALTVAQFKDTVGAANAGTWYDTDDATPGVQPKQAPVAAAIPVQPGRLVTQAEKWVDDAKELAAAWASADQSKIKVVQRGRLKIAIGELRAQLDLLEASIEATKTEG